MKISPQTEKNLFTFTMALTMSVVISFIMTLFNFGLNPGFFPIWIRAFGLSFLCALPLSILYPLLFNSIMKRVRG